MQQLVDYLIKLSATLMVMYLFYRVVLCRLTFHNWNRWYLLGYSIAAFFIPLVNINPFLENTNLVDKGLMEWVPVVSADRLTQDTDESTRFTPIGLSMTLTILAFGIIFLMGRLIVRCISVKRVRSASRVISDGVVKIYHVDSDVAPFSFGNAIFINRDKHSDDELRDIIRHEFIHVKQSHTIDVLFAEFLCVVNWYNPFAWLIRSAIRQNLEFIADHEVIQNGVDRKNYQYLLLKVVGSSQPGIASNFNFTSLKKRIAMMNKLRSAKIHLLKFMFVIPLVLIILLAFRSGTTSKHSDENPVSGSFTPAGEITSADDNPDTIPAPAPKPNPPQVVRPNAKGYIITVSDDDGEAVVMIRNRENKFVKAVSLTDWEKDQEKFESEYGRITFLPAGNIPKPPAPVEAPALPWNVSSIHVTDRKATVGLKDGTIETYDFNDPKDRKKFIDKYGAVPHSPKNPPVKNKPNPGSQENNKPNPPLIIDSRDESTQIFESNEELIKDSTLKIKLAEQPVFLVESNEKVTIKSLDQFAGLVLVDDKQYYVRSFNNEVKLDPRNIQSIEVLKGESAKQLYGNKGANGVIRITTKKPR